jgi:hypothetical protein
MNAKQTPDQNRAGATELLDFRGTRPLFAEELRTRLAAGARCVRFEFCLSFLFFTILRQSPVYLTVSWQERYLWGLWYSFLALLLGPWGAPWGLLCTPRAIWVNTIGGSDCTHEILTWLDEHEAAHPTPQNGETQPP